METKKATIRKSRVTRLSTNLVSQFFHSIKDGKINWQGVVIGNPEPGWYLVQLFSYLDGQPNVQRLMRIEDMREWLFYDSAEMMEFSWEHGMAREGGPYRDRISHT